MSQKNNYFNDLNDFCEKYDKLIRVVFLFVISAILIAIFGYLQQVEIKCKEAQEITKKCDNYCKLKYFVVSHSNDSTLFFNLTNKDVKNDSFIYK